MPVVDLYNSSKEKVGTVALDDTVFASEVKEHLFHMVVRYQLAARRQGTHMAKRRAQVAGGGRKPWKQKGTGRARQGSTRAPHWRGGGSVFGPLPRSHAFKLNKKVRRAALRSALSRRLGEAALVVLDGVALPEVKTRHFAQFMKAFAFESLLVVVATEDTNLSRAARNIPGVTVLPVAGLNVYDVLRHRNIALTAPAIEPIVKRLGAQAE
jgi:large subunit ribosomal protein L4